MGAPPHASLGPVLRPKLLLALLVLLGLLAGIPLVLLAGRERTPAAPLTTDPVARGCALDRDVLARIWRGHHPERSEDITAVPMEPNYLGSFRITSHSGPWDYLQRVPLVLYGPDRVEALGLRDDAGVTLADVYPTVGDWTGIDLPARAGDSLREAVKPQDGAPKLLVFVMWDGVGRNVLERWPGRWPNLERLEAEGASYTNATVGSSPSITPSTHATLGTGSFPRAHGVTGIQFREGKGIKVAQARRDPQDIQLTTFADELDLALDNEPKVGLLALRTWHIPMMGRGSQIAGADKDQLAIMGLTERIRGNNKFFHTPDYVNGFPGLQDHIDAVDQQDGVKDGEWRGHPIAKAHDNPAWPAYQTDVLLAMWEREGYGADEVPDLFFTNYKMTDIVGHQYSMDSPEMGDVLEAQDAALGELVEYLDENVGDYALVVSSDHGHTPNPERSEAWPISQDELEKDMNEAFGVSDGQTIKQAITAVGPFLDPDVLEATHTSLDEVARFLNAYTIADNWPRPDLPEGYEDRGDERVFEAAFPSGRLDEVMTCRFGSATPPKEMR